MLEIDNTWVIFRLDKQEYGLPAEVVREMILLTEVARLPDTPDYFRGIINLRNRVLPVMDLRKRLGMSSMVDNIQSMIDMLQARQQDHVNWLTELRSSVAEDRDFKLTTDPHKCAFGKWYDTYHTENPFLHAQLSKFDAPHKHIHGLGVLAVELVRKGESSHALQLIQQTWDSDLASMIRLFKETQELIQRYAREIGIIVEQDGLRLSLAVDAVSEVITIPPDTIEPPPDIHRGGQNFMAGLAKVGGSVKILLNVSSLYEGKIAVETGAKAMMIEQIGSP